MPLDLDELVFKNKDFAKVRTAFVNKYKTAARKPKKQTKKPVIELYAGRDNRLRLRDAARHKLQCTMTYHKLTTGTTHIYTICPVEFAVKNLRVGRRRIIWGHDVKDRHIKMFAIANIKRVTITGKKFVNMPYPVKIK